MKLGCAHEIDDTSSTFFPKAEAIDDDLAAYYEQLAARAIERASEGNLSPMICFKKPRRSTWNKNL
jgi:hypothetical protein